MNTVTSTVNERLELAHNYVLHTHQNVFLTGKAGTGKTTFLHQIRQISAKRLVVAAPTGVAAINAGGVTIHSLFQLPFGPIVPEVMQENRKFSRDKIKLLRTLDLLIIDEISMVRADVLDGIDAVLRRYRYNQEPFGGVQLLLIGDMQQLPPVIRDEDWALLQPHYDTGYFFSSHALQATDYVSIELTHIYRQADQRFIDLLNGVREKTIGPDGLADLNQRYLPDFQPADDAGYITLSTHNQTAQAINAQKLADLTTPLHTFEAAIADEFPEQLYPTEATLNLKVGAQVMFVKNDSSREKLYYNGKIGQIKAIDDDGVTVQCPGEHHDLTIGPEEWQNIRYTLDPETKEIKTDIIGTFTQLPLRLAWAITIHKSQGLTFERAIIDAGRAFAHGQVYVALSRCKTLEGLVLRTPIPASSIKTELNLEQFHADVQEKTPSEEHLHDAKRANQALRINELFAFEPAAYLLGRLRKVADDNARSLPAILQTKLTELGELLTDKARAVSHRFRRQLPDYVAEAPLPEANEVLQERLRKAGDYFHALLSDELLPRLRQLFAETDNKQVRLDWCEALDELEKELVVKQAVFGQCRTGFDVVTYGQTRHRAELDFVPDRKKVGSQSARPGVGAGDRPSSLYFALMKWRSEMANEHNATTYQIMPQKTLVEIAEKHPNSLAELAKIKGIGKAKANRLGPMILPLVRKHPPDDKPKTASASRIGLLAGNTPRPVKDDLSGTHELTLDLFLTGKSPATIATTRGLTLQTVETHLAKCIAAGQLPVEAVLSAEKLALILDTLGPDRPASLTDAVTKLNGQVTFAELRYAYAGR
ncbi:helix-turn-helix domain-containing protein [Fibrella aquatilis]|uniref:AAA family ATPase n=1 Tax=Fibrella aquatilis TaxID=2817059 RepID=A0A939G5R3_9BACT|nr:helix-turn-helix domain-containing protein [Fibrella aquatilis]MBO0932386.1 AAA family ATPase [Fibrella aquatilis]